MSWTYTTSGAVIAKAGTDTSATGQASGSLMTQWEDEAESYINVQTRKNWTVDYATLSGAVTKTIDDAASSHAAMALINFDLDSYPSLAYAQTMLDFNLMRLAENIKILKEQEYKDFMEDA